MASQVGLDRITRRRVTRQQHLHFCIKQFFMGLQMHTSTDYSDEPDADDAPLQSARLWRSDGWTARVLKNDGDEGWAVAMIRDGEPEPALVGPWTMGRDKKNPKPLDAPAFSTLVKTASEVIRRHEQQLQAILHKRVHVSFHAQSVDVLLDITPDEDDPTALLTALDENGAQLAQIKVTPDFKLNATTAYAWVEQAFPKRP